ncbi:zinc-dependent alcohol dehydrogenase family protein [Sinorhizobium fredii]|uniref:zinc-dependent alcohol dehydrogenase family protein n=1 Tax=Rhizobium fredii TaxID=380 RepID=UPI0005956611|nr:NAD(P)-dependent alcohol dehydrogenase [Sinorhizobium fredii]WOS65482.1 NAD(P)-dependent alcohol dehydrogenase [Sinorhizobium fredii GR64]
MRRYVLDGSGTVDGLRLEEVDIPEPRRGEVLVRMRAVSLNFLDLKIIAGLFPANTTGLVPLSDGAGEVLAVGEDVWRFKVGDRVCSLFFPRWISGDIPADARAEQIGANRPGVLSDYVVFDQNAVTAAPATLTFEEAATLPCAALTAWQLHTGARRVLPGETVLTQGTGGVSLFALQFARLAGALPVSTTSSPEKAQRLDAMGAAHVIDYRQIPEWGKHARELTAGRGVDHIMEIGEAGTLEQSILAAATGAQINLVGRPDKAPLIDPALLMRALGTYRRISVGSRTDFEAMSRAIDAHHVKPVIDRVFEADEVLDAFHFFQGRGHFGKVVVRM